MPSTAARTRSVAASSGLLAAAGLRARLRRGDMSVTEACFTVGCSSLGSFSARFTEIVGETPSAYRARDHEDMVVVPACQAMILTRPRRPAQESRIEEASSGSPA